MHDILELGAQQNISQLKGTVFRISHLGNVVVRFFFFSFEKNRCVRLFDDRLLKHSCLKVKNYAIILNNSLQTLENLVISSV